MTTTKATRAGAAAVAVLALAACNPSGLDTRTVPETRPATAPTAPAAGGEVR